MLTATIRRERSTNTPYLYFVQDSFWLNRFPALPGVSEFTRSYMHTRTRPAEPTDPDCVALVAAYSQPLRIVRRLPR